MTWTWGTTIVVYPVARYGWVPVVWHGLDLPRITPGGVSGYAWEWAPYLGIGYSGTIRAARLMARRRYL
ncbi:MAG: hypothetical protein ABT940_13820 [Alphaproteobacteria bacterium]